MAGDGVGQQGEGGVGVSGKTITLGRSTDDATWARVELDAMAVAEQVRAVRARAVMSQVELARRLGVSQAFVSQVESGRARAGVRFLRRVIEACDGESTLLESAVKRHEVLPADWFRDLRLCSGLDPDTLDFVRRGSARDLELLRTDARWRVWSHVETYACLYDPIELAAAMVELNVVAFREGEAYFDAIDGADTLQSAVDGDGSEEVAGRRKANSC